MLPQKVYDYCIFRRSGIDRQSDLICLKSYI